MTTSPDPMPTSPDPMPTSPDPMPTSPDPTTASTDSPPDARSPDAPATGRFLSAGRRVGLGLLATIVVATVLYAAATPEPNEGTVALHATDQGWADESTCAACHDQADHFWETGHARTLSPAGDAQSRELLSVLARSERLAAENTAVRLEPERVVASTEADGQRIEMELDWCFGSGHHAATWAGTMRDSSGAVDLLEFRWSHYAGGVIDVTPGQPESHYPGRFGKLGVWFDGPKAYRCFSCHASVLPVHDGAIAESEIHAGVTCQRCHGPRLRHVQSDGNLTGLKWPATDRTASVHRCAQCHRRADELSEEELTTDNRSLIRFQPAGLVQSRCYTESSMDCMTCHDPHTPLSMQESRGIWQCVQCHDPVEPSHVLCGAGESTGCLECHMPSLRLDAPTSFTDHWIRVRQPVDD